MSASSPLSSIYLTLSKNSSKLKKLEFPLNNTHFFVTYHAYLGFFIILLLIIIKVHLLK